MPHPVLEKLLILQERDTWRQTVEARLAGLPAEVKAVNDKIAREKEAIEAARMELRELETKKKLLETEIGSAEDKAAKYRTQQLSVRKNDEYQALGHEIETMEKAIGALEENELEVLYAIDEAKRRFAEAEATLKANITGHEDRLRVLAERDVNDRAELAEALAAVATARTPVPEPALRLYDRVATRHSRVCVPLQGATCGGCHLRVSSEAESAARKSEGLATCDQCGRILWWEF